MLETEVVVAINAESVNIRTEKMLLFIRYDIILIGEYDGKVCFVREGIEKSDWINSSTFLPKSGRYESEASVPTGEP